MNVTDFTMDFFSLQGKNAIVTGGNCGLGQAFSVALAKAGANVLVISLVEEDGETKGCADAIIGKPPSMKELNELILRLNAGRRQQRRQPSRAKTAAAV